MKTARNENEEDTFASRIRENTKHIEKCWRGEGRPDVPVLGIQPCSEDLVLVGRDNVHWLYIVHVDTSKGKGFLPQVRLRTGVNSPPLTCLNDSMNSYRTIISSHSSL